MKNMSEFDFIKWIQGRAPGGRLTLGIGDDAAELALGRERLVFAADMLLEGRHFDLAQCEPRLVGRKALAVNLSDMAAMAAEPLAFVVSLALPRDGGRRLGEELTNGMIELAETFDVALAGGDTTSWDGPLVVNVAIVGRSPEKGAVTRSGARPGDWIFVTGRLGGSLAGHHLRFAPRVKEALLLREDFDVRAMIDLSDGLASDLRHISEASRCGAVLRRAALPVSEVALSQHGDEAWRAALGDGEDFELCFALPPDAGRRLAARGEIGGTPVTHVGQMTEGKGLQWDDGSDITETGFVHDLR